MCRVGLGFRSCSGPSSLCTWNMHHFAVYVDAPGQFRPAIPLYRACRCPVYKSGRCSGSAAAAAAAAVAVVPAVGVVAATATGENNTNYADDEMSNLLLPADWSILGRLPSTPS